MILLQIFRVFSILNYRLKPRSFYNNWYWRGILQIFAKSWKQNGKMFSCVNSDLQVKYESVSFLISHWLIDWIPVFAIVVYPDVWHNCSVVIFQLTHIIFIYLFHEKCLFFLCMHQVLKQQLMVLPFIFVMCKSFSYECVSCSHLRGALRTGCHILCCSYVSNACCIRV